ncbi:unnamed protein product [Lupinus luteus]|uniref:Uncharacterized protein n=1 Tax=Lupinus luteus TaxID=3873 RepID=A0AAV1W842_LUPLU
MSLTFSNLQNSRVNCPKLLQSSEPRFNIYPPLSSKHAKSKRILTKMMEVLMDKNESAFEVVEEV